ncbi:MAG: energy-coupling factor transporter transmembrane component T family protein [Bacillota bacterium]
MLSDITIGQYIPGDSLVHRMDPRSKVIIAILYIIAIFMAKNPLIFLAIAALFGCVLYLSQVSPLFLLRGLRPLLFIIIFTAVVHLLTTPGMELFGVWKITVTREGIYQAAMVSLKLILLVISASLLTLTTSPVRLTDGIESILLPFSKVGVPARELAMMMTIALRFIPTLFEETDKIMKAQIARGADFESRRIFLRARNIMALLIPLFVSCFRRADDLIQAMESRGYRGGQTRRTSMREMHFSSLDYWALSMMMGVTLITVFVG